MHESDQLFESCQQLLARSEALRERSEQALAFCDEISARLALIDQRCHLAWAEARRVRRFVTMERASS